MACRAPMAEHLVGAEDLLDIGLDRRRSSASASTSAAEQGPEAGVSTRAISSTGRSWRRKAGAGDFRRRDEREGRWRCRASRGRGGSYRAQLIGSDPFSSDGAAEEAGRPERLNTPVTNRRSDEGKADRPAPIRHHRLHQRVETGDHQACAMMHRAVEPQPADRRRGPADQPDIDAEIEARDAGIAGAKNRPP